MDLFIRRPPEFYELYNCSLYDIDSIPLERRQNIPLGMAFVTMGAIQWLMYVPCMFAIWKRMASPCFKIMFFMGILDLLCLALAGVISGFLGMLGAVYCSYPNLIYVLGGGGYSLYVIESSVEIILALNRCIELCSSRYADMLFRGWRTWVWMVPPSIYAFYTFFYTKPLLFSGIYFTWFFNPYVGYADDFGAKYYNPVQMEHNWFVVIALTSTYATFGIILVVKTWHYRCTGIQSFSQKMIFVQVVLISVCNMCGAMIFIYMQYFRISEFVMLIAEFAWLEINGLPPVIYLSLNKTLRRDTADILLKFFFNINRNAMTAGAAAGGGMRHAFHHPHTAQSVHISNNKHTAQSKVGPTTTHSEIPIS